MAEATRPTPAAPGPPPHVTFAACCLVFFVSIMFIHNHNSMAYVHSNIQYTLDAPAGWLQSTSKTTVRSVTIQNAAGEPVTGAALTAITTTTTVAAASSSETTIARPVHLKPSFRSRHKFGRMVQHRTVHASEVQPTTAEGPLPGAERDIELNAQRVAEVVQRTKEAEVAQLEEQGAPTQPTTAAEKHSELYHAGAAGSVVLSTAHSLSSCPDSPPAPQRTTALVLLADGTTGAAALRRALDGLLLLYSQANADVRAAFRLYIGLDGGDQDVQELAHQYALGSLGAIRLVLGSNITSTSSRLGSQGVGRSSTDTSSSSSISAGLAAGYSNGHLHSHSVRAEHVQLMLHTFFNCLKYQSVLLLEGNWLLLPDFFQYHVATQRLLAADATLYCISAWNPLAHQRQQQQQHRWQLQRVDATAHRGCWLLTRPTGLQLLENWPQAQPDWQQHIRNLGLQQGRQCIVPSLPRMQPATARGGTTQSHIVVEPTSLAAPLARSTGEAEVEPTVLPGAAGDVGYEHSRQAGSVSDGTSQQVAQAGDPEAGDRVAAAEPAGAQGLVQLQATVDAATAAPGGVTVDVANTQQHPTSSHLHAQHSPHHEVWMGRDLSNMLPTTYRLVLQQRLAAAPDVDAASAAAHSDTNRAVRVSYTTEDQLVAATEALGVTLSVTRNIRYCYMLPAQPATQHCQGFVPDTAYEGVVEVSNAHGVCVYLAHQAYLAALDSSTTQGVADAARQPLPHQTAQTVATA